MNGSTPSSVDATYCLEHLSNDALLASTRNQVGRSNHILAALLAHLAEVEARGLHRLRACASLYTYCVYELRFSGDAALRRCHAARIARRFPVIFARIAAGEVHLTAVLMLGPHLTDGNHLEVLGRAKYRTKREIAGLVRELGPLPDVPPCIEPLGPSHPPTVLGRATFAKFAAALCGPVRELPVGERPKDWAELEVGHVVDDTRQTEESDSLVAADPALEPLESDPCVNEPEHASSLSPQRYKVQFTASQEYVDLLEQARDLLGHGVQSDALDEIHLRAMQAFVAELKKRKYAASSKRTSPRKAGPASRNDVGSAFSAEGITGGECERDGLAGGAHPRIQPRLRGRYVATAVRRVVVERDGARCAYVDAEGRRCRETRALELHHIEPFALGGASTVDNLSLRCRAHNALAAEHDFGKTFMTMKIDAEPRATEGSRLDVKQGSTRAGAAPRFQATSGDGST